MIQDRLKELVANPPPKGKLAPTLEALATELGTTYQYLRKEFYAIQRKTGRSSTDPGRSEMEFLPDGSARFNGTSDRPVRTKEEALAVCQADMSLYDVEAWGVKSWGTSMKLTKWEAGKKVAEDPHYQTNYAVWIKFKPKDMTEEYVRQIKEEVLSWAPTKIVSLPGSGVGVVNLADFHIGADIKELLRTLDFDINILQDRLAQIAVDVNSKKYSEVHVNLVGDFIESFTGLNHLNSWRSMDKKMVGANVVIVATRILLNFLSSINNLVGVNMVAGNHDRSTPDSKIDNVGEVAGLLAYTLGLQLDVDIDYHPFLISKEIDGMWYVLTHGHTAASQKDAGKFLFEHGNNKMYNLLIIGHTHSRKTEKTYRKQFYSYESVQVVSLDDLNYRKIVLAPLFTGNYYSETLGFASNPGYLEVQNNGRGRPTITDHSS